MREVVRGVAERVAAGRGFELVDIDVKPDRAGTLLRLFVDKEGGIGLDDLQSVSEEVSAILDVEDPIASAYTLEVSSPGLDRPLHGPRDFERFKGKLAKVSSYEPVERRRHWTGRLLGVEAGALALQLEQEGNAIARVPLEKIAHARLEVEFPKKARE